jgi:hypothetical protein
MAENSRRNVHVFSSSGTEVAGEFSGSSHSTVSTKNDVIKASSNTQAFQSPRSSVGSTKSAPFPSNGLFTHVSPTTIAPSVARHLIPIVGTISNLGVMSYAPHLLVCLFFVFVFSVSPPDTIVHRIGTGYRVPYHRGSPHASVHRQQYVYSARSLFPRTV